MNALALPNEISGSSQRFLTRLVTAISQGQMLDDPRDSVVCRRWVEITEGIPDIKLFQIIPQTLACMFKDPETKTSLEACGLTRRDPMRLQAIAPYVVGFRRFMAARSQPADENTRNVIAGLRVELRALKKQFDKVFDQAAEIEAERERLQKENSELQQQVLSLRIERDDAQRKISDGREKAFRFMRLYLFMLKEELQRKKHDAIRLATVEIAIETNMATLEALGWKDQAVRSAHEILGKDLYEAYFDGGPIPGFSRKTESLDTDSSAPETKTAPYLPLDEFRRVTETPQSFMSTPAASDRVM